MERKGQNERDAGRRPARNRSHVLRSGSELATLEVVVAVHFIAVAVAHSALEPVFLLPPTALALFVFTADAVTAGDTP